MQEQKKVKKIKRAISLENYEEDWAKIQEHGEQVQSKAIYKMFTQKMKADFRVKTNIENRLKHAATLEQQPAHVKPNLVSGVIKNFAEGIARRKDEGRINKA